MIETSLIVIAWIVMVPCMAIAAMGAFALFNELFGGVCESIRDYVDPGWRSQ